MPSHLVPKDKAKTSHDEISFKEAWPISTVVGAGSGLSRGQVGCRLISSLLKQFRAMPYRNTRMPWPCSAQCPKRDIASINPDPSFECRWARDLESCTSFFFWQSFPILVVNLGQYRHHSPHFPCFFLFDLVCTALLKSVCDGMARSGSSDLNWKMSPAICYGHWSSAKSHKLS